MELYSTYSISQFMMGLGSERPSFFKGCNLRCKWCHNPESISFRSELEYYQERCIGCGACFTACPKSAHELDENRIHRIHRTKCNGCFLCSETCYANAIVPVGKRVDTGYVMEAIGMDEPYYRNSGGGVTFSGGECMLQTDFLAELLAMCREKGIHTAVDTAGNVPWSSFEKILPFTDLFLYDVKAADSGRHEQLTGVGNEMILQNLKRLSASEKQVFVRIPFIPAWNEDQLDGIGELLKPLRIARVEIIPYHRLGSSKYTALGLNNELQQLEIPTEERIDGALSILRKHGLFAEKA